MVTLTRPGVYIDESSLPTYVSATPGVAQACFVSPCIRGPITPVTVRSWSQFTSYFGGFDTTLPAQPLHLAVYSFFSAGGTAAVIIRAPRLTNPKDVAAAFVFDDGNNAATLQIQAISPGSWGGTSTASGIYVTITENTLPPNAGTFNIDVYYQGTDPAHHVENWPNLVMSQYQMSGNVRVAINANYAPSVVNSPYTGSKYVTLVDQNSTTAPPANNPAAVALQPLTGGVGGGPADQTPTQSDLQTAWQLLDLYPNQPFVINLPGDSAPGDVGALVNYAQGRKDCFVVIDPPVGQNAAGMVSWIQSLTFTSAQAAVYFPNVIISDPYSTSPGATRLIPPGGFVVGQYLDTDATRGVQKAPAGLGTSLPGANGLELTLSSDDQGTLTQVNVNCLISVPGSGVVIWGARTLSPYLVTRYVSVERTLIYLATQMAALTQFAVFEPNDAVLWNSITQILSQFLTSFWQSGGLSGSSATAAYFVTCDDTINTPSSIQQGKINIQVGVALEFPAEFVIISIGQWAGGQSISVTST